MSKEKNLTFNGIICGHEGPFAIADTYMILIEDPIYEHDPREPWRGVNVTQGAKYMKSPAIDRLHEFEKLGMEPEEIGAMKNAHSKISYQLRVSRSEHMRLVDEKRILSNALRAQQEINESLIREVSDLKRKLQDWSDPFHVKDSYETEKKANEELRKENFRLEQDIEKIKKESEEIKKKIEFLEFANTSLSISEDVKMKELQRLNNENVAARCEIRDRGIKIEELGEKLKAKTKEYSDKIMAMSKDVDDLQEENKRLKLELKGAQETSTFAYAVECEEKINELQVENI